MGPMDIVEQHELLRLCFGIIREHLTFRKMFVDK